MESEIEEAVSWPHKFIGIQKAATGDAEFDKAYEQGANEMHDAFMRIIKLRRLSMPNVSSAEELATLLNNEGCFSAADKTYDKDKQVAQAIINAGYSKKHPKPGKAPAREGDCERTLFKRNRPLVNS